MQKQFWEGLKDYSEGKGSLINLGRKPRPQHWFSISFGTSRCHISLTLNSQKKYIGCEMYIRDDPQLYEVFNENKESIEARIGESLSWKKLPNATASRILLVNKCDPTEKQNWPEYYEWCLTNAENFSEAFKIYV